MRGLQKMVEEGRDCADILEQISSAQESLVGVSKALLKNHLRHCVAGAARSADPARAERAYDEIVELLGRHWR
jgi:DNA-binding FrmR family transcriptional regulator